MLCGAEDLKAVCRKRIGEQGHVTSDGLFSWTEVECLGACCNAPMVQINDDYYEDLTPENFAKLLDDLAAGRPVKIGSQVGRVSSEPVGGLTSLTSLYGADGHGAPIAPGPANDQSPPSPDEAAAHAHAEAEAAHIDATLAALPADATPQQKADAVGDRPLALAGPRGGGPDDLQRIKGVGPVNEKRLHELGVYHFDQIAAWARTRFAGLEPICPFPAASIVSNGWFRPPNSPLAEVDSRMSKPTRPRRLGRSGTERCWKTRIASSPISTGSATAA